MDRTAILQRLKEFDPDCFVEVRDLTGTQDHWEVQIQSTLFQGLSRVKQHQKIMGCFQKELLSGEVHALSLKTLVKN